MILFTFMNFFARSLEVVTSSKLRNHENKFHKIFVRQPWSGPSLASTQQNTAANPRLEQVQRPTSTLSRPKSELELDTGVWLEDRASRAEILSSDWLKVEALQLYLATGSEQEKQNEAVS